MKLALLKGNRFNPWHLQAFNQLRGAPEVTAFRAHSEIQKHFEERDDHSLKFKYETIHFDTQSGNPFARIAHTTSERYLDRAPRIVPFHDRLRGFDLIQSWELFTDWTSEALRAKEKFDIPVALMIWDNIPFNMEKDGQRRQLKKLAVASADKLIVHTERSRRMLAIEGAPEERIQCIRPGVDVDAFAPGPGSRDVLGIDKNEFVILFVGWLLPRKGIDFLLLAIHELIRERAIPDRPLRLVVVGSGPGKPRVDALIERTGIGEYCTFAGSVPYDGMTAIYRSADLFVLPSIATEDWQEQFGMSLIEAMACGLPIVSTYSGAIPEVLADAGVLCQPNDFLSLYEAIARLANDDEERTRLGQVARARAQSHFALDAYADALSTLYESMLS